MKLRAIKNGRLAMFAFAGVISRKETKLNLTTNCSRNIILFFITYNF